MKICDPTNVPPEHWRPGVETRMIFAAENGATALCIFEQWVAPGNGAPTHAHPVEEVLTVRAGEAEMWIGADRVTVKAGQSLLVPPGKLHGFRNSGAGHIAYPCGAGLADLRGDAGGRGGTDAALGRDEIIRPGLSIAARLVRRSNEISLPECPCP